MNGITNEGLVLACSAIGAGLAVIAGIGPGRCRDNRSLWSGYRSDSALRQPIIWQTVRSDNIV